MNKTEYVVYWTNVIFGPASGGFDNMGNALAFMQELRKDPDNKFIAMASEMVENVGKMGVDSIVDNTCPDGSPFLGRTSRYGVSLQRARKATVDINSET